jgi:hypothetical protein
LTTDHSYVVTLQVSDGTLTDTSEVHISVTDAVGISGDTHAVEGSSDDIVARFIRYSRKDANVDALTATDIVSENVGVVWDDFDDTPGRTGLFTPNAAGQLAVTFDAETTDATGMTIREYVLSAVADGVIEGIERFQLRLNPDPENHVVGWFELSLEPVTVPDRKE